MKPHDPAWVIFSVGVVFSLMAVASAIGAWSERRNAGTENWLGPFVFSAMAFTLAALGAGVMVIAYTYSGLWPSNLSAQHWQNLTPIIALGVTLYGCLFSWIITQPPRTRAGLAPPSE